MRLTGAADGETATVARGGRQHRAHRFQSRTPLRSTGSVDGETVTAVWDGPRRRTHRPRPGMRLGRTAIAAVGSAAVRGVLAAGSAAVNGVVAIGAAGALALAGAAPAAAHPLGDPQTVRLAAEGRQVTAVWSAAPDDLLVLGAVTGALDDRREYVFETGAGGEPEPVGDSDAERLAASDAVAGYLAAHLTVAQGGRDCPAEVDLSDLTGDGAELVFTCERDVAAVDVAVTVLTDADPAYRTVAFAEAADRDRLLYTDESPTAAWRFDARSTSGPGWEGPASIGAAMLLVAAGGWIGLRRLRKAARS
jgi:hypothetical protein